MAVPHAVIAAGWIPFIVVIVLTFIFSWSYIRYFQHSQLSEVSSTLASVFALFITLLISALVPVDVFLVSYMKNQDGSFKTWAEDNSTRTSLEETITYSYYVLYGLVAVFVFFILPFMYFFFEEKDDEDSSVKQRCCSAFKYTAVFLFAAFVILITGALVPLKSLPSNMTSFDKKLDFLKDQLETYNSAQQSISILVGILSMLGMLSLIMYTGYGMSALPFGMMRCCKKYKDTSEGENERHLTRRERDEERANMLRAKSRAGRNLTRFERNEMRRIEQDEMVRHRLDRKKKKLSVSWCGRILVFLKPFEVVFGVLFFLISLLLMVSLTITSIDKALHSLGPSVGYSLPKPILPNPVNIAMVYAQNVFPLDYVLFTGIVLFFIFACMNGIKRMGIWCCCIKMFKIRAGRTMPQALLFMAFIMMFMVIALNVVLFTVTPQYVQYGNQKYALVNTAQNTTARIVSCNTEAPEGDCIMSRVAMLLNTLFYKAWFFGAVYYWSIWLFLGVYYLALTYNFVNICRSKPEDEMLSSGDSDSDVDMLIHA